MSDDDINAQANEKRRKHKVAKDKMLAKKVFFTVGRFWELIFKL